MTTSTLPDELVTEAERFEARAAGCTNPAEDMTCFSAAELLRTARLLRTAADVVTRGARPAVRGVTPVRRVK